ncbi:putative ABC transport system ATP-binding protein [Methanofollis sp. W23]|uniref:ABC transporter ATP-binding protein n=1 Tax=Methanofollis sp. W23 TaxID=2817849 RepID=UPI001AEA7A55|nr:ABC transporter ATP-binding protein [Methanofollis sp. W23]MBP2146002.1 putative ABC transport system ATP-binding protein [Methanofollis sp. W23]
MGDEPVIRLVDVVKVYPRVAGDVRSLDGVSLSIDPGEFVAIMGPSGSGKSTLLNQVGCLDTPTEGDVIINGVNTRTLSDDALTELRRDAIGFIFQKFNLIPVLTARENVEYPYIIKHKHQEQNGRGLALLEKVGLDAELATHTPNELSGGQQQRVAIARALVNDPAILLCDEPTGNLDSKMSVQIMDLLKRLNEAGKTVVMVTHDPSTAEYAGRVVRLKDGRLVA